MSMLSCFYSLQPPDQVPLARFLQPSRDDEFVYRIAHVYQWQSESLVRAYLGIQMR